MRFELFRNNLWFYFSIPSLILEKEVFFQVNLHFPFDSCLELGKSSQSCQEGECNISRDSRCALTPKLFVFSTLNNAWNLAFFLNFGSWTNGFSKILSCKIFSFLQFINEDQYWKTPEEQFESSCSAKGVPKWRQIWTLSKILKKNFHKKCEIFRHFLQLCQNNGADATWSPGLLGFCCFFWR